MLHCRLHGISWLLLAAFALGHLSPVDQAVLSPKQAGTKELPICPVSLSNHQANAPITCQRPFKRGQHTLKKQQGNDICASQGEAHWSGTIDVTDKRRLFYWFAESRNDPANDPIIVSIAGGPGSSSIAALLAATGPCTLRRDSPVTEPNPRAINNYASLLTIDQPASAGLSPLAPGAIAPSADEDGAEDFQTFLNVFFKDVFPSKAHLPIHFLSGSYGGHFSPTYLHHILESRRHSAPTAFRGNVTSMVIYSPLIDPGSLALGNYETFCANPAARGMLDQEACQQFRQAFPECWKLRQHCILSDEAVVCKAMMSYCTEKLVQPILKAGRHPMDLTRTCNETDMLKCDFGIEILDEFVNQPHVLQGLGLPTDFNYTAWNFDMRAAYTERGETARSSAWKIGSILDAHRDPANIGDVRVLIMGGGNDPTCNVAGNKLATDEIHWSGQADYRLRPWTALPERVGHSGEWKAVVDGRLKFVAIDDAGHLIYNDQPEAFYNVLNEWLKG